MSKGREMEENRVKSRRLGEGRARRRPETAAGKHAADSALEFSAGLEARGGRIPLTKRGFSALGARLQAAQRVVGEGDQADFRSVLHAVGRGAATRPVVVEDGHEPVLSVVEAAGGYLALFVRGDYG